MLMAKRRRGVETAREWVESRLSQIRERLSAPLPTPPAPKPPRYQPAGRRSEVVAPPELPPPGVPASEWRHALKNVQNGSRPCLIEFPPEPVEPYPGAFTISRFFKP